MKEFFVTFGCRYATEPHPYFNKPHPDGWLIIEAEDELSARRIAINWFPLAFLVGIRATSDFEIEVISIVEIDHLENTL